MSAIEWSRNAIQRRSRRWSSRGTPSSDGLRLLLSSGGAPLRGECGAAVAAYRGVSGLDIVPPDL
ncbi:hypothetical protein AB0L97_19215 [Nocardia sp. NPDC051911]|uniref:hypothetical protein n=1 Tax=Nocardia sp. NPDC051911 TaxID=3154648 RepID=UPI00341DBE13